MEDSPVYETNIPEDPENPRYVVSRQVQPAKKAPEKVQSWTGGSGPTSNHNSSSQRPDSIPIESTSTEHIP